MIFVNRPCSTSEILTPVCVPLKDKYLSNKVKVLLAGNDDHRSLSDLRGATPTDKEIQTIN